MSTQKASNVLGSARLQIPVIMKLTGAGGVPPHIKLSEHPLLPAGGLVRPDRLNAVFGIPGHKALHQLSNNRATSLRSNTFIAEFHYPLHGDPESCGRGQRAISKEDKDLHVKDRQWIHTKYLPKRQRLQLCDILRSWLPEGVLSKAERAPNPAEILLKHPGLAHRILDEFENIDCVVYPGRLDFDQSQILWLCTLRADESRIVNPRLVFVKDVTVSL